MESNSYPSDHVGEMKGLKEVRPDSSRVRNPYDKKGRRMSGHASRVKSPEKLLVMRIPGKETKVWEDSQALHQCFPSPNFSLKCNVYIQKNALSVQLDKLTTILIVGF